MNREPRTATVNLSAFPKRPLALAEGTGTGRKILVLLLSGLFFAGCFLIFALVLGPGVLEDIRLSKEGKLASRGTVSGEIRSRLFTNWGDLKLDYTIPGRSHNGGVTSFSRNKDIFFVGDLDESKEAQIYYLENAPSIATVSYALDLLLNREITLAVSLAIELGFVVMAIVGCFRVAAIGRSLRRAADHPEPIEVTIVRSRFYRRRHYIRYEWQNQRRHEANVIWRQDRDPLFTRPTRDRALAIKGPDGHAHLVDSEFRPFELTEQERERVIAGGARS
ncbi:MAG: hypothetical protein JOZ08_03275 [Verrucomicrobia bacterium]|nr:hypothetical protein [Verrucomicrobiota bacterium]